VQIEFKSFCRLSRSALADRKKIKEVAAFYRATKSFSLALDFTNIDAQGIWTRLKIDVKVFKQLIMGD
jgi:hypothetical protein